MSMLVVHHLLQNFLMPPLNTIIIIIAGAILVSSKYRKLAYGLIGSGIFLIYIQATPFFAQVLNKALEMPPVSKAQLESAQAIIVLGGGVQKSPEYANKIVPGTPTMIRLHYAAIIAKQYPYKLLIASGGDTGEGTSEAQVMQDTLINIFNITNPIIIEAQSLNTDEEAKFAAQMLLPQGIKNIVVVSQAFHMRRSLMLFRKYGFNPVGASTDYYHITALNQTLMFIPDSMSMNKTAQALHEIFGYLIYAYLPLNH